jgi:hypothetical protein
MLAVSFISCRTQMIQEQIPSERLDRIEKRTIDLAKISADLFVVDSIGNSVDYDSVMKEILDNHRIYARKDTVINTIIKQIQFSPTGRIDTVYRTAPTAVSMTYDHNKRAFSLALEQRQDSIHTKTYRIIKQQSNNTEMKYFLIAIGLIGCLGIIKMKRG